MREKKSGGLLDVFIIMVILLSVVGIVLRMQALRVEEEGDESCTIRTVVRMVPAQTAECISEGEALYTADGALYGVVEEIEAAPAQVSIFSDGKNYTGAWDEGRYVDLTLRLSVSGRMGDAAFLRDGKYAILVGESVLLYGERVALNFLICEVSIS